jgi:hypothetical protein
MGRVIFHPVTEINSEWIKDLKLKLLQEKIRKALEEIGLGNYFLKRTPIVQEIRARIDKWDYIKLKSFCT